jgi:uncharacterized membrane protein
LTSDGVTEGRSTGRAPRWMRITLIVSLAINLLIVGAMVGKKLTHKHRRPSFGSSRSLDLGIYSFSRSLPAERRTVIRKALRPERANLKPLRKQLKDARLEAADVLGAEPFDLEALKAVVEKITKAQANYRGAGAAMFLKTVTELTPEERLALSKRWKRIGRRHKRKKGEKPPTAPAIPK